MNIKIFPTTLKGNVTIPPSKSMAHRLIICSALSDGVSNITNINLSKDIVATIKAMEELGAKITIDGDKVIVNGIKNSSKNANIDCGESGSTLRFIIPIVSALGVNAIINGHGKLPERPITTYINQMGKNGVKFDYNGTMPFGISGNLKSGIFEVEGDISSQFISGLLFALPLLDGDSKIKLLSKLESKPYVDLTIDALNRYGIKITEVNDGYEIKGNQKYIPTDNRVEGDFSQAAFFYTANVLGSDINIKDVDIKSLQGDKKIVDIISAIGYNGDRDNLLKPFEIDASDIPDLVPILTVLASFCSGKSEITNVARLRIKESDRLQAISECLNKIGGNVVVHEDKLTIYGIDSLKGGVVEAFNDHRIAMAMSIAAIKCTGPLTILGANCVDKSYPAFFEDYKKLGGIIDVITLE